MPDFEGPREWMPPVPHSFRVKFPMTTLPRMWWDVEMPEVLKKLGKLRFLRWLEEKLRVNKYWRHTILMMAWNDHNSEYNLDRNIRIRRENREGDRITNEDVAQNLLDMLE